MRIAILGAGAVGGFYGARLARAGHEVTFIARGANLEVIRSHGISVKSGLGDISVAARAESDPALVGPVDLVVVAVKTYSNSQALRLVGPLVGPDTAVLTLQNGIDSADQLAALFGRAPLLAGTTYIAVTLVQPGLVEHVGSLRRIVFGEAFGERVVTPRVERVRLALAGADVEVEAAADSRVAIWEKFIYLAPIAGLTAAARLPIGAVWVHREFRDAYSRAASEVEAIARHEGIPVAPDVRQQTARYLDNCPPAMRTSMMVDITSGRPLELEALVGTVVGRGRAAGIPTPVMATLHGILKPFEHGAPSTR